MNRSNLRWFDQSQPQTLQIAVILLYIRAVFGILFFGGGLGVLGILLGLAQGAAGFGVANSKRIGWYGGIVVASLAILYDAVILLNVFFGVFLGPGSLGFFSFILFLVGVGFDIALLVALIHPQSREYQKIWFE